MKSISVRSFREGFVCLVVLITLWVGSTSTAYAQVVGWTTKASMPTERLQLGVAAASNGKLYAVGGQDNSGVALATVEEYDPATNAWTTKANMPTARFNFGIAAASNGKLYAIGGSRIYSAPLATVEEYDPATNVWTTKASMPTARYALGVASASNGKLYAVAGIGNVGAPYSQATVEEYDPVTDVWTTKANMPTARSELGFASANNGKLYAIGGLGRQVGPNLTTVEEYDPATDAWTTRASMRTERYGLSVASASNGKLYAVGGLGRVAGIGTNNVLKTVEEFDPATNVWTTAASMPTVRYYLGFAKASNGKLYAIGGYNGALSVAIVDEFDATTATATPTATPTVTPTTTPTVTQLRIFIPIAPRGVNGGW